MGNRKNFNRRTFCELASAKDEIVAVVPLKAEGAPVPGAGFSPDAVPGNSAEMENTRTNQLLSRVDANGVDSPGTRSESLFQGSS
jgi:hypothetical protein